jgi:hypothetical protein
MVKPNSNEAVSFFYQRVCVCINAGIEIQLVALNVKKNKKIFFPFITFISYIFIYLYHQTNTMDGGGYMDTYSSQATSNAGSVRVSQGL